MDAEAISRALRRISHEILERNPEPGSLVLVGIPLLAIAGALGAASIAWRNLRLVALAAVAVVPAVQFVLWMQHPAPPPSVAFAPWFRAARFLHE